MKSECPRCRRDHPDALVCWPVMVGLDAVLPELEAERQAHAQDSVDARRFRALVVDFVDALQAVKPDALEALLARARAELGR